MEEVEGSRAVMLLWGLFGSMVLTPRNRASNKTATAVLEMLMKQATTMQQTNTCAN